MKKLMAFLLAVGMIAGTASAQEVLSRNAVGYVKVDAPADKFVLIKVDFEDLDGNEWTVANLLGDQLPSGSVVAFWTGSEYVTEGRTRSGWSPGTNIIRRGDSFFIRSQTTPSEVLLMGEVPDDEEVEVLGITGLMTLGYPYPVEMHWTNMNIAKGATSGDVLALWDPDAGYITYGLTRSGWGVATNIVFKPGEGFWFRANTPQAEWTEVKPYTWP